MGDFLVPGITRVRLVIAGSYHEFRYWQNHVATREESRSARCVDSLQSMLGYDEETTLVIFYGNYRNNPVMAESGRPWERYPYQYCRDSR